MPQAYEILYLIPWGHFFYSYGLLIFLSFLKIMYSLCACVSVHVHTLTQVTWGIRSPEQELQTVVRCLKWELLAPGPLPELEYILSTTEPSLAWTSILLRMYPCFITTPQTILPS